MTEEFHDAGKAYASAEHECGVGVSQSILILLMICTQPRFAIGIIRSMA
jgi:hypothetical protein